MELNKLKSLILSMRRSKTNMSTKANTLAQAIETKGEPDMDTHELLNLLKDALTNRHNKEFYAEQLSQVIGEPNKGNGPVFNCLNVPSIQNGQFEFGEYVLSSPLKLSTSFGDITGVTPYCLMLTKEQTDNIQIIGVDHGEKIDITNESVIINNGDYGMEELFEMTGNPYAILDTMNIAMGVDETYQYIIVYDGVEYTYDMSNCIVTEVDAPIE